MQFEDTLYVGKWPYFVTIIVRYVLYQANASPEAKCETEVVLEKKCNDSITCATCKLSTASTVEHPVESICRSVSANNPHFLSIQKSIAFARCNSLHFPWLEIMGAYECHELLFWCAMCHPLPFRNHWGVLCTASSSRIHSYPQQRLLVCHQSNKSLTPNKLSSFFFFLSRWSVVCINWFPLLFRVCGCVCFVFFLSPFTHFDVGWSWAVCQSYAVNRPNQEK